MKDTLLALGIQKRNKEITMSWQEIAEQYGDGLFTSGESFRCWVKEQLRKEGKLNSSLPKSPSQKKVANATTAPDPAKSYGEKLEINKDGSHTSDKLLEMSAEQSKDVSYLLAAHGYDTRTWELISARNNFWNVYSQQDGIQTLYSSKISVKPRTDSFSVEDIKEFFAELSKNYQSPIHEPIQYSVDGKMLEINITDLHVGKLAWDGNSNDTYNHVIARDRFFYIINDVLTKTKSYSFEKIVFVWSNDFFHIDNLTSSTTSGTRQDIDIPYQQMYKLGVKMLVEAIDLLSQIAPVHTFYVGSNHDKLTSYFATEHLAAWFRNHPNVHVDTDAKIRKYIEFGDCLIQFSHGHAEGKRISETMSVEEKEAWGRTKFKEVHAGHFHSEKTVTKDNGVIVRYLGSPSGTDNWHYESGYVGSIKKGESFVWDKEKGLINAIYTTVD